MITKGFKNIDQKHIDIRGLKYFFEHTGLWRLYFKDHLVGTTPHPWGNGRKNATLNTLHELIENLSLEQIMESYRLLETDLQGRLGPFEITSETLNFYSNIKRTSLRKITSGHSHLSLNLNLLVKLFHIIDQSKSTKYHYRDIKKESDQHIAFHSDVKDQGDPPAVIKEFCLIKSALLIRGFSKIHKECRSPDLKEDSLINLNKLEELLIKDLKGMDEMVATFLHRQFITSDEAQSHSRPFYQKSSHHDFKTINSFFKLLCNIKKSCRDHLMQFIRPIEMNLMAMLHSITVRDPFKSLLSNGIDNILNPLTRYATFLKQYPFTHKLYQTSSDQPLKPRHLMDLKGLSPIQVAKKILSKCKGADQTNSLMKYYAILDHHGRDQRGKDAYHDEIKKILLYQMLKEKSKSAIHSCINLHQHLISWKERLIKPDAIPDELFSLLRMLCLGLSELLDQYQPEVQELYPSREEKHQFQTQKMLTECFNRTQSRGILFSNDPSTISSNLSVILKDMINFCRRSTTPSTSWQHLETTVKNSQPGNFTLLSALGHRSFLNALLEVPYFKYQPRHRIKMILLSKIAMTISPKAL